MSDLDDGLVRSFFTTMWSALGGEDAEKYLDHVEVTSDLALRAPFGVTDLGVAAMAAAGSAVAELVATTGAEPPRLSVDRALVCQWFRNQSSRLLNPTGRRGGGSDVSGEYETADGRWLRFQANYQKLREATIAVLDCASTKDAIADVVRRHQADEVEQAIMDGGGSVAASRTLEEWAAHPQGSAIASEPLVDVTPTAAAGGHWQPHPRRPLAGIRVLDFTRVLAGPTGTRFLAGYGAEVLRIDGPLADPRDTSGGDIVLGKRCVNLDLSTTEGHDRVLELLAHADVLVHGYRPGALDGLGLGREVREATRPGLVEVVLDAYGWTGPWNGRRGFDTLVQFSSGLANAHAAWGLEDPARLPLDSMGGLPDGTRPALLPAQTLDHSTGYLIAAAAVRGLTRRLATGNGSVSRLALARTARLLADGGYAAPRSAVKLPLTGPFEERVYASPGGPVERYHFPLALDGLPIYWDRPGDPTGSATPTWITAGEAGEG